jgi:D-3-phosphoglycerate dehydrogenase
VAKLERQNAISKAPADWIWRVSTPATHLLIVRHLDRVGVLAHVFGRLKEAGINVQQTENVVFEGAAAAIARIQVDQEPAAATIAAIRSGSDIIDLSVVALG